MSPVPYFDHNATSPLTAVARDAWLRAQEQAWYNPASLYRDAARVRLRLDGVRESMGALLNASPERVVFTSGATEASHAIAHHLKRVLPESSLVAINPTEHPCVLAAFGTTFAGRLHALPLDDQGVVTVEALDVALTRAPSPVGAVVVMAANNETGVLQPWLKLADRCRQRGIPLVCDATQWIGKLPAADFARADWVFASAHKWGGTKGAGWLLRAEGATDFHSQLGGEQQRGHRGGTEDFPAASAMLAAWAEAERSKVFWESERSAWREGFEREIAAYFPEIKIVGAQADRLWNTSSVIMPAHENTRWVTLLDKAGFAVSTGSACAAGKEGPSHVLAALGVSPHETRRVLRFSAGWETTQQEWMDLARALKRVSEHLQATTGSGAVVIPPPSAEEGRG